MSEDNEITDLLRGDPWRVDSVPASGGALVTLLAGGDTVFLFDAGDDRIELQRFVIDVMYPADEIELRTIDADKLNDVRLALRREGITVLDYRRSVRRPA